MQYLKYFVHLMPYFNSNLNNIRSSMRFFEKEKHLSCYLLKTSYKIYSFFFFFYLTHLENSNAHNVWLQLTKNISQASQTSSQSTQALGNTKYFIWSCVVRAMPKALCGCRQHPQPECSSPSHHLLHSSLPLSFLQPHLFY